MSSPLSLPEQAAVEAYARQVGGFKRSVHAEVRDKPEINEAQLKAFVVNMPDPHPEDATGIRDRGKLFDEYVANAGGIDNLKWMMLNYPIEVIEQVAEELGRPLPPDLDLFLCRGDVAGEDWGETIPWATMRGKTTERFDKDGQEVAPKDATLRITDRPMVLQGRDVVHRITRDLVAKVQSEEVIDG